MRNFFQLLNYYPFLMANSPREERQARRGKKSSMIGNAAGLKLFFNERDSDVAIKVEYEDEKWQFPAHKLVLCTMSEVFRRMLDLDMLEKNTNTITIKDSSPLTIKQFLRYIYIGIVEFVDWNEATSLLKIAHKYNVATLVNLCANYLTGNIFISNVCLLFELARTYSLSSLEIKCEKFILEAGFIVSATEGFFNLKPASIEYLLSSPYFNLENEGSLLTSLREWAVCECTRKCVPLTNSNVLAFMKPFLKLIQFGYIPECHRTFIPLSLVRKIENKCTIYRKPFHTPASLQYHTHHVKCSVELGVFHKEDSFSRSTSPCLKFSVDNHIFFIGFRLIGLFHKFKGYSTAPNYLILRRDDDKVYIQLNLMSLPWSKGATVGGNVWQELVAYMPYPVRIDPFNTYTLCLKSSRQVREDHRVKWPITRLESEPIATNLSTIKMKSHGVSFGITQLFILPAPLYRNICNIDIVDS